MPQCKQIGGKTAVKLYKREKTDWVKVRDQLRFVARVSAEGSDNELSAMTGADAIDELLGRLAAETVDQDDAEPVAVG